jgi:hypothetical protein
MTGIELALFILWLVTMVAFGFTLTRLARASRAADQERRTAQALQELLTTTTPTLETMDVVREINTSLEIPIVVAEHPLKQYLDRWVPAKRLNEGAWTLLHDAEIDAR